MLTSAFSFTRLRAQFIKEVLSVLRDPRSRMVVFVPPILQLLVFAFAATLEVRNVDIAVYDQDAGRWSHELVQRLDSARFMAPAHALYRQHGFAEIEPYAQSEVPPAYWPHWVFMQRAFN